MGFHLHSAQTLNVLTTLSWLPGSYFLPADAAGLLLGDDALHLLVEDPLLLHLRTEDTAGELAVSGSFFPSSD